MNEILIKNWNEIVSPEDTVYHLGDFAMGDRTKISGILSRLNGTLILIRGNHDHKKCLESFETVLPNKILEIGGKSIELVHNPSHANSETDFVFCGHVHDAWAEKNVGDVIPADDRSDHKEKHDAFCARKRFINVGVDVRDFRPRTFEELIASLGEKNEKS